MCTRQGHRQLPEVVLTQFVSPDDEHDMLETCRGLKIKINTYKGIRASRWSFTKNLKSSILSTSYVYVTFVDLSINSDYFPIPVQCVYCSARTVILYKIQV